MPMRLCLPEDQLMKIENPAVISSFEPILGQSVAGTKTLWDAEQPLDQVPVRPGEPAPGCPPGEARSRTLPLCGIGRFHQCDLCSGWISCESSAGAPIPNEQTISGLRHIPRGALPSVPPPRPACGLLPRPWGRGQFPGVYPVERRPPGCKPPESV